MSGVLRAYAAMWHWLRGRRVGVGPGDVAIGHARERTPMLLALAGVLTLETALVGLLVPWPVVHVLDGLALLQVVGIAAVGVTYPHVLRLEELVLRDGSGFELCVPLASVVSVRVERRDHSGRWRRLVGEELIIAVGGQTDVLVTLSAPVRVDDGGRSGGTVSANGLATRVRFRADDPALAVSAIAAAAPNRP